MTEDEKKSLRGLNTHPGYGVVVSELAKSIEDAKQDLIVATQTSDIERIRFLSGRLQGYVSFLNKLDRMDKVAHNEA